ncbi:MAG: hypothetical protein B7Z41_03225 [Rhizobiales bacterium 12-66-7]|nr:MAG: hypothetical protein B7Z41_03225 [Rhizobiales bacterium 12-66-7]
MQKAVSDRGLPEGVFSLLYDSGRKVGQGLVADRRIKAVGFTGSRAGGTAFMKIAAERAEPIPVYAEMSSINPVILFPAALAARGAQIGTAFSAALSLGAGQFCTNPGLVLALEGAGLDAFLAAAATAITGQPAASADAVSPPATENASGKLLAPNTATGPSGTLRRRRSGRGRGLRSGRAGSMRRSRKPPSRTTCANRRNWPTVRPRSPSRRGRGKPVSCMARSISTSPMSRIFCATASRNRARSSRDTAR